MRKLMMAMAAALTLCGCGQGKGRTETKDSGDGGHKAIVLYYSQTGTTEKVAEQIASLLGVDAVSFDVKQPYSGTYEETIQRCLDEMDNDYVPDLARLSVDINDYDVVFLGYPVWFSTYARPVMALLENVDFEGMTIVPFCTFGSGGLESSVSQLRAACPEANVTDGFGIRVARMDKANDEVKQFLIDAGFLEGEKTNLPDYSPQTPLTDEEKSIFEAACGDYPMPIGTPQSCGKREGLDGTDYLFAIETTSPNGEKGEGVVYITCPEGGQPVFTRVVR